MGSTTAAIVLALPILACSRPGPEELDEQWRGTTIATYCEAGQPCPPATLDLGTAGGDRVYGGVPAMGAVRCTDHRSVYPLAHADVAANGVTYRFAGEHLQPGVLPIDELQPGRCNHLLLRHRANRLESITLTGSSEIPDGRNDSLEEADSISDGTVIDEAIEAPGDVDYYQLTVQAGEWWQFTTLANPEDDADKLDTVLTLLDENGELVAYNDDELPRFDPDSELIYHFPAAGTYYLRVEDYFTSTIVLPELAREPQGDPSWTYTLSARTLDSTTPGFLIAGDGPSYPLLLPSNEYRYALGRFASVGDRDGYSFTAPPMVDILRVTVPGDADGLGSTAREGTVIVDDGAPAIPYVARIDRAVALQRLLPSIAAGAQHTVQITHAGELGTNPFYVLKLDAYDSIIEEIDLEPSNNTPGGASVAQLVDGARYVQTHLASTSDVDHVTFTPAQGTELFVTCSAAAHGSGVRGLSVSVLDSAAAAIPGATVTETDTAHATLGPIPIEATRKYYLRLSKSGQDSQVSSDFARCSIAIR